ncbi:MAG TPA: YraN family protein [Anaerolineales bacterium]|nr:YraN family protein [Anaerolineales bacterium]
MSATAKKRSKPARLTARQMLGQRGEQLAADKLGASGYAIVERNYRCAEGEIDIVARHGEVWAFVEVRTRRGRAFGSPEESITARKKAHLIAAAQSYLQAHNIADANWRIDVAAVEFNAKGHLIRVDLIENAVNEQ